MIYIINSRRFKNFMKNDSPQHTTQNSDDKKCLKGNTATMVCFSQHCKNKAFVCKNEECQCHLSHKLCLEISIQKIEKIILAYSYSLQPLEAKIQMVFDKAIDKLSQQRDNALKEIRNKYYHNLGLNKMEKKFIDVIKNGADDEQINCEFVWKMNNDLKSQQKIQQSLDQLEKEILKIGEDFDKEMNTFSSKFGKLLQQVKQREEEIFLKSSIIKTIDDQNKLLAFFTEKPVDSVKMLYRASQNQFFVSKFHEKCDYIGNTLTIVLTQYGKVIGGFTSLSWYKPKNGEHYVSTGNNSKDHFLFSLTNNHKFQITSNYDKCICLYGNNSLGPAFGYQDLRISNKANENYNSQTDICSAYTNSSYCANNSGTFEKFAGGKNFKIKQWEVWKIQFKKN